MPFRLERRAIRKLVHPDERIVASDLVRLQNHGVGVLVATDIAVYVVEHRSGQAHRLAYSDVAVTRWNDDLTGRYFEVVAMGGESMRVYYEGRVRTAALKMPARNEVEHRVVAAGGRVT